MPSPPFPKSNLKAILDFIAFPLRTVLLNEPTVERMGLTSLQQERINAVWPYLGGRVLDIGAGNNRLVRLYKNGTGIDVHDMSGGATILKASSQIPFQDEEFDTVCFLACLNHIPERHQTLQEALRILKPGGRCLITMINPVIGYLNHLLCWYEESHERGMKEGEVHGFWKGRVIELIENAGFRMEGVRPFLYGLNTLYIASKESIHTSP